MSNIILLENESSFINCGSEDFRFYSCATQSMCQNSVRFFKGGGRIFAVGLNGERNMNSALTRYCVYSLSAKSLCTGNIDAMLFVLHLWRGRDVSVLECCVVCLFFNFLFSWLRSPTEYQPSSTTQPRSKKHILPCLRLFTLPSFRFVFHVLF